MARIILIIAAIILALLLYRWVKKQPANKRWQYMMLLVGVVLLGLVATGKLHWLFALAGALIPALQRIIGLVAYLPILQKVANSLGGNKPSSGQTSQVETEYLQMQLDHDSGKLSGIVKTGLFAGHKLDNLSLEELLQLRKLYSNNDEDSRLLLENYLDRTHGTTWRTEQDYSSQPNSGASSNSQLSEQEAYAILGIESGADKNTIIAAHKRLIQKLHPDRGGSSYLATKINQAKDLLINQHAD
ncbi:MAG: DnaJ domain-containing protein [Gammaproteobacteria bacterium]|nr:DnaJ domain-containing protein [Gammaproteobacteria bacterium]